MHTGLPGLAMNSQFSLVSIGGRVSGAFADATPIPLSSTVARARTAIVAATFMRVLITHLP